MTALAGPVAVEVPVGDEAVEVEVEDAGEDKEDKKENEDVARVETLELEDPLLLFLIYSCTRFPLPQYSEELPLQSIEQSVKGWAMEPVVSALAA